MTKNSFSKSATRARMAETGEPYSVAARSLAESKLEEPTTAPTYAQSTTGGLVDYSELIVFCERMAIFTDSGLSFLQSFRSVVAYTEDPILREALEFVLTKSAEGASPSKAMALRPGTFRGVFPELMRVFEQGGGTPFSEAMRSMAKLYRTELEMEKRIGRRY